MVEALHQIGRMVVADAELILRGLPPQLCRRADPSVASRLRSMPAGTDSAERRTTTLMLIFVKLRTSNMFQLGRNVVRPAGSGVGRGFDRLF